MSSLEPTRSPLEVGALIALAVLAFGAAVGLIAVLAADSAGSAVGTGFGVMLLVFLTGATIVCGLACLARGQMEILALGGIVTAGLALDLFVLAIWLDIENEAYGKIAAVASAWSFLALLVLGLTLAVRASNQLARALYLGTIVAALAAGVLSTWLIGTAGEGSLVAAGAPLPVELLGDEGLLRPLGVALVLLGSLWFGALAATRLELRPSDVTG